MVEFDEDVFGVWDVRVGDEVGEGVGGEVATVGDVSFDLALFWYWDRWMEVGSLA